MPTVETDGVAVLVLEAHTAGQQMINLAGRAWPIFEAAADTANGLDRVETIVVGLGSAFRLADHLLMRRLQS
jgi:hypothetical protein